MSHSKMKITGKTDLSASLSYRALSPFLDSDLIQKPSYRKSPSRKTKNASFSGAGVRLKRDGAPAGRRSRPETPLLRWKLDDGKKDVDVKDERSLPEFGQKSGRRARRGKEVLLSARKLAAGLWRLQLPEDASGSGKRHCAPKDSPLGFQSGVGHVGVQSHGHHKSEAYGSVAKDLIQNPHSLSGSRKGFLSKIEPSFKFSNSAMEGVTKWEPFCSRTSDEVQRVYGHLKLLDQQISAVSVISELKMELEQSRARVDELETEQRSSKKKLEHFLRKVSEERATWRSREHEKIRAIIDDIKADLHRERKNRQRMEMVNSKLVNELTDAKLAAKRFMQEYEKERKDRELIEEVCNELAKEVGEDKAEAEALKRESMKLREEVDDERKMLQMAEVWREERVQMKLVDAKLTLEEKYSQMNKLVADLETFLSSRSATPDAAELRKAEFLRQAAASVNIHNLKEFTYDPPNPDDIFSVIEDVTFGERNDRELEPCVAYSPASHASKIHTVSPEVNVFNKDSIQKHSNAYLDQNGDVEEDESGWETVSHVDDQGSSYSSNGSDPSVNNICQANNVLGSGIEWEKNAGGETPITEISEVCSVPTMQLKKVSSISQPCRSYPSNGENYKIISVEGINGRLSNRRLSNGAIISPDRGSANGGYSPSDLGGQLSSPLSGYTHITRGMKGCIEWPRGMQKNSLKARLLEARMESQKIQLRQVLKQKI
ncbi:uncharacterized protein LOC132308425 [Cornus florida]|uniref:uncharacterized protein LOC132308425 n=1 Tax=Cornus florida TaxID=4283 RepID=UPI0028A14776|nr:uncharacterized protein LOC132308425 [Cornus florida]